MRALSTLSLLAIVILTLSQSAEAQGVGGLDPCLGGTTYYVAFPDTTTNTQDARFRDREPEDFVLMLFSAVDQPVQIGRVNGAAITLQLKAGKIVEFNTRTIAAPIVTEINRPVANRVLKITADESIILYAYMTTTFGAAGFTPMPVEEWGREYYAATWPGGQVRNVYPSGRNYDASERKAAPAFITVIAAEDNTEVKIFPTGSLAGCSNCDTVTLNEGEAYQVESYVDLGDNKLQPDLAGTRIVASRPIGVLSGNTRTSVDPVSPGMLAGNSVLDLTAEWLTPIEMHGTEFVFTPTWDKLRQRDGSVPEREAENVRIIAGIDTTWVRTTGPSNVSGDPALDTAIAPDPFHNWRLRSLTEGRAIYTDKPAQAFHAINSVAEFNGTTGSGNNIGSSYNAWGSAMVELVPRERWGSFAPFRAPTNLWNMSNFVNVVTDTNHRDDIYLKTGDKDSTQVVFARTISGSDLVWTTISVNPGITYQLIGNNGANFTGHLYGLYEDGFELYRPGAIAEYEENIGQMYAMPFPSTFCTGGDPRVYGSEIIDESCRGATMRITASGGATLNLRFLRFVEEGLSNASIRMIQPVSSLYLDTARYVDIRINFFDPSREATAEIHILDRDGDGTISKFEYRYEGAEGGPVVSPDTLDFGRVIAPTERSVLLVNRFDAPLDLQEARIRFPSDVFSIERTVPSSPWDDSSTSYRMEPGDSLEIWLRFDSADVGPHGNEVVVSTTCGKIIIPLVAEADFESPCLEVNDLDFGGLKSGEIRMMVLEICNRGGQTLSFDGGSGSLIEWLLESYDIAPNDIQRLGSTSLGRDQCVTLPVTFTAGDSLGLYRTVARFKTNGSTDCRDSSIWTATVGVSSVDEIRARADGLDITSIAPNPGYGVVRLRYSNAGDIITEVALLDATGREHRVEITDDLSGEIVLNLADLPSGLYFVRLRSAENEVVRSVMIVR